MLSSEDTLVTPASTVKNVPASGEFSSSDLSLDLLELELCLNDFSESKLDFAEAVGGEVRRLGGDFLFELPASGLAENCARIAAIRIPEPGTGDLKIAFALLDRKGSGIRIEDPGEKTEGLKRFADAFVGVLERI